MDELNGRADPSRPADANDLTAVRDLLAMPSPSPDAVITGRARLLAALSAPQEEEPAGRRGPVGRNWRWPTLRFGLAGAAVAAALGIAVILPADGLVRLSPVPGPSASAEPTARQILLAAATAMAKAPSHGAYWRTKVVTGQLFLSPDRGYVLRRQTSREVWLAKQGGGRDTWTGRYLGAEPATTQDETAWRAAGSPSSWKYPADVTGLGRVSPGALVESAPGEQRAGPHRVGWRNADGILSKQLVTWKALRTIPTEPTRLRAYLEARIAKESGMYVRREMEAELREACLELLSGLPVSPEVRASAYQILASMPGMKAEGQVTDPLGRTGQALSYQVNTPEGRLGTARFVLDSASGLPLAEELKTVGEDTGGKEVEMGSFTAYEEIGWTDEKPGTRASTSTPE